MVLRPFAPPVLGFAIGFVASIPIAGPTAAMVFKHGIQGDYAGGRIVALGSSLCEACYAGVAYHFFGLVSSKLDFILPFSKVLGAVILVALGTVFTRYSPAKEAKVRPLRNAKSTHSSGVELSKLGSFGHGLGAVGSPSKGARPTRKAAGTDVFQGFPIAPAVAAAASTKFKDDDEEGAARGGSALHGGFRAGKLLLGMSLSGLNPGLLATYGGVISTVFSSGWLQFTAPRAVTFGAGAAVGINVWFSILLRLLERYKDSIRPAAVKRVVRLMGWALLLGGLYLAHGAWVHFFGSPTTVAAASRSLQDEAKIVEGLVDAAEQQQHQLKQ